MTFHVNETRATFNYSAPLLPFYVRELVRVHFPPATRVSSTPYTCSVYIEPLNEFFFFSFLSCFLSISQFQCVPNRVFAFGCLSSRVYRSSTFDLCASSSKYTLAHDLQASHRRQIFFPVRCDVLVVHTSLKLATHFTTYPWHLKTSSDHARHFLRLTLLHARGLFAALKS